MTARTGGPGGAAGFLTAEEVYDKGRRDPSAPFRHQGPYSTGRHPANGPGADPTLPRWLGEFTREGLTAILAGWFIFLALSALTFRYQSLPLSLAFAGALTVVVAFVLHGWFLTHLVQNIPCDRERREDPENRSARDSVPLHDALLSPHLRTSVVDVAEAEVPT